MTEPNPQLLRFNTVAEFEAWVDGQDGNWELHDGVPVAMAPERAIHARIKARAWQALDRALGGKDAPCEAFIDSIMVPGPGLRQFKPDVVVSCGPRVGDNEQVVRSPVILVEVLSPSTAAVDAGLKLDSYFRLPSVRHYLLASSDSRRVIQHQLWDEGRILTRIHHSGPIFLDPPGVTITVEDIYAGTGLMADGADKTALP